MKNHFVLARYKENISKKYLENLLFNKLNNNNIDVEIFIYDKFSSRDDTHKLVPNIGREHYAWFTHIIETWDNPPEFYSFIHPCGPESIERPEKFNYLMKIIDDYKKDEKSYAPLDNDENKKSRFIVGVDGGRGVELGFAKKNMWFGFTKSNIEDVRKQKYIPTNYQNMGEWWEKTVKIVKFPDLKTMYGMCITSSKNIQSWGIDFWKKMLDQVIEGGANGEIGHFLERSMYRFSQGK